MEIRIVLDRAEPPAGRLRVVRAPGQAPGPRAGQEISFHRLAGLLRALYEVTAEPGEGARPGSVTMPRLAARAYSPLPQYLPVMTALAPVPRICGREVEIRALGEALDRVASGGPAIMLVEGEAGIGKTRLLAQVLQDARGRGMLVAAGRAEELERTRPFGVLAAAFGCTRSSPDPRRAAIAGLLASQGAGDLGPITVTSDPGLRFRVVDAFTDLAEELALAGSLVIGLDNLQWADPSSLLTLGALCRRLDYVPVGVIGCLRPSPRVAELDRLAGALEAAGAQHLILRPLTGEAVTGLVAQAVAAEPGPRLLAEVAGAGGNPLFVTELLAALTQEGTIATAGGRRWQRRCCRRRCG